MKTLFVVFLLSTLLSNILFGQTSINRDDIPEATMFYMPVGERFANQQLELELGDKPYLGSYYQTQIFSGSYIYNNNIYDGWYVAADFNSDTTYYGDCYGEYETYPNCITYHPGEDWNGNGGGDTELGQPVYAVAVGRVAYSGYNSSFGNNVQIIHKLPTGVFVVTHYAHLNSVSISEGDLVDHNTSIGTVGNSGSGAQYAHLHFEIRAGTFVDTSDPNTVSLYDTYPYTINRWPGTDNIFISNNYFDPSTFLKDNNLLGKFNNSTTTGEYRDETYSPSSVSFINKYNELATDATNTHVLGQPYDNGGTAFVHEWYGMYLQDFYSEDINGDAEPDNGFIHAYSSLIAKSNGSQSVVAYLLKEGFWDYYMNLSDKTGGQYFAPTDLGAPTTDEYVNLSDNNTYQDFEHGYMKYVPDSDPDVPGTVFVYINSNLVASGNGSVSIASTGDTGNSGSNAGAVSIYQWTIPISGIQDLPYDFSFKLKNIESDPVTYESIRLRALHANSTAVQQWEWNDETVPANDFWQQTVNHAFADTGDWVFKVFVTKDGQSYQVGAISPEVQEKVFNVAPDNPETVYNPSLLETESVQVTPSKVPIEYDQTQVQATVYSISADTTHQHLRFELETQNMRFTMFGDTTVVLAPYDTVVIQSAMDPMYNLGLHKLYVSAYNGSGYNDLEPQGTGINPKTFDVYQPTALDSVKISGIALINAIGDSIAREQLPNSTAYVRVKLKYYGSGEVVRLQNLVLKLYDSDNNYVSTLQPQPNEFTLNSDTVFVSDETILSGNIGRYTIRVFSGDDELKRETGLLYPYTITVVNEQPVATTNVEKQVVSFDGSGDKVQLPSFNMTGNDITMEGWVRLNSHSSGAIINQWANEGNNPEFVLGITNSTVYAMINGVYDKVEYAYTLELDRWYHVAATYSFTTKMMYLYLDGQIVAQKYGNAGTFGTWPSAYIPYIGRLGDNTNKVIDGYIDDVRLWNVVRTQSQINATKDIELSSVYYSTSDSGLIGYWQCNTDMLDLSVSNLNGSLGGDAFMTTVVDTVVINDTPCTECDTMRIYIDPQDVVIDDGSIYGNYRNWSTHHDLNSGTVRDVADDLVNVGVTQFDGPAWGSIKRYALPVNTTVLPDSIDIISATLNVYIKDYRHSQGQSHFISVVQGDYQLPVVADDYDNIGGIAVTTEGSERLYYSSSDFDLKLDSYNQIALDSTGLSWINSSGYIKLGLRQGDDVLNYTVDESPNVWGFGSYVTVATADYTDSLKRPYLEVVYSTTTTSSDTNTSQTQPTILSHSTLSNGLVSYWQLDEASGVRIDSHGSNDLNDNGGVSQGIGKLNQSADFESDNSEYLSISDANQTGLDITSDISISTWIKLESSVGTMKIVAKGDAYNNSAYTFMVQNNGSIARLWAQVFYANNNAISSQGLTNIRLNTWTHVAMTWQVGSGNSIKLYVDGIEDAYDRADVGTSSIHKSSSPFWIGVGQYNSNLSGYFDGLIDNTGIWNRALTASEVSDLYNNGNGMAYDNNSLNKSNSSSQTTPVVADVAIPTQYNLHINYPNPFNPTTVIKYDLPQDGKVRLVVYNILGQMVATLVDDFKEAGYHQVVWNGHNMPSGMYFYKLVTDNFVQTNKMLLIK